MARHHSSHRKESSQPSTKANSDALRSRPFAPILESQALSSPAQESQPAEFSILDSSGSRPQPIQAKLTIGSPGDKYEQEADRAAAQVVQQINSPQANQPQAVQWEAMPEEEKLQMKPIPSAGIVEGDASPDLETEIAREQGRGQSLEPDLQAQMGQAMGADFSGVKIHTNTNADQLNKSIQAKAFTTGQDIFFRQGAYQPGSSGGQELIAHELTHVMQQNGHTLQRSSRNLIQRTPEDVWEQSATLPTVSEEKAKQILKEDFYCNWFLAQEYLLSPNKWKEKHKKEDVPLETLENFKGLMKILIKLRQDETDKLLEYVLNDLKEKEPYKGMKLKPDAILKWSAAGSQSLTSDIDVNLKGAGSIEAVTLFNHYFKAKLGWPFEAGTVYDVNVYAQDFMTPKADTGKPFEENKEKTTITPVEEVSELKPQDDAEPPSLTFDAFALNQDVWSLVKMRTHMREEEWNAYRAEMLRNARGEGNSDDERAREIQVEEQLSDAEHYYNEYERNLKGKLNLIDDSQEAVYENMRSVLSKGKAYLSEHQQDATKKMMAANLIYQEKLGVVSGLRAELQEEQNKEVKDVSAVKNLGIRLKNALSEAIIYANEAYLTQGAVHFSVIGQQIGGGRSQLIMSDDEHLHSFREQIGDTLKVLNEHHDAPLDRALLKAGKYIDRMAKSAQPLIDKNAPPAHYKDLADIGAAAATLKSDKTKLEDYKEQKKEEDNLKSQEQDNQQKPQDKKKLTAEELADSINKLNKNVTNQQEEFPKLLTPFKTIDEIRQAIITLGQKVEADFRKAQATKNSSNSSQKTVPKSRSSSPVQAESAGSGADFEQGFFEGILQTINDGIRVFTGFLSNLFS